MPVKWKRSVGEIMKCSAFSGIGDYHKKNLIPCQDCYSILEKGDLSILVMCDGAGNKKAGAIAARVVSDLVAEFLCENFRELYIIDSGDAKRRIAKHIDNSLKEYSILANINCQELACTIMAVAMDKEQRCICLHLGDGIILQYQYNQEVPKVISAPMNGLHAIITFVTMNCDLAQYMQFYRWKEKARGMFLMMTDGAQEYVLNSKKVFWNKEDKSCNMDMIRLRQFLDSGAPADDYSCGIMCYNDI